MTLNTEWSIFLEEELQKKYFLELKEFIKNEYKKKIIYPEYKNIFRAFNLLLPSEVKVVIIGQDPYHGKNQANGLSFSVPNQVKIPPSLANIYKELHSDLNCHIPSSGDLTPWSKDGVLLINSVLTVVDAHPNSHKNKGWEIFTNFIIQKLSDTKNNIVFILWGGYAQEKTLFIDETKHLILKAPHPSPLSSYRGFFGSKPFSKSNIYLQKHFKPTINWCIISQ